MSCNSSSSYGHEEAWYAPLIRKNQDAEQHYVVFKLHFDSPHVENGNINFILNVISIHTLMNYSGSTILDADLGGAFCKEEINYEGLTSVLS